MVTNGHYCTNGLVYSHGPVYTNGRQWALYCPVPMVSIGPLLNTCCLSMHIHVYTHTLSQFDCVLTSHMNCSHYSPDNRLVKVAVL